MTWILGGGVVLLIGACLRVYSAGQRVRMQLATLVSTIYLDERQLRDFGTAYEEFLSGPATNTDASTRGAISAAFIERYADHLSLKTRAMAFLGMSHSDYQARRSDV